MSGSRTNHSFEPILFSKPVRQIGLNQSVARAALYKLLNQNSLSDFFKKKKKKKFSQLLIFYSADWKWGTEETVRTLELRGEIKDFMVSHGYVKRWID